MVSAERETSRLRVTTDQAEDTQRPQRVPTAGPTVAVLERKVDLAAVLPAFALRRFCASRGQSALDRAR